MKRWMVETRAIVMRTYFVDAEDEKDAEAASCNADPDLDDEASEETMSITQVPTDDTIVSSHESAPIENTGE